MSRRTAIASVLTIAALAAAAPAQQFQRDTTQVPAQNTGWTEQVDFADVDGDGDWDAAFADGGDLGNQQNRLWINQGGAQAGVLGAFLDATASRFPVVSDSSRDVEFADWDADGDVDLFVSNHCSIANQPSRFWVNQGGVQAGAQGFYVDETSLRWIGLGGAGSSMPPGFVLAGGGYVDWCWDSDFADFDNDGDLDLVHSSAGGVQSGNVPTRIFLNDGSGFFREFNPSGFQLPGGNIANGNPGLWCEGLQQHGTLDPSGTFCDVADSAISIDPGDIDGDFDLDLVRTAVSQVPRMFQNRLAENGGTLGFRDVTGAAFPPGYSTGVGAYEELFADFDADGDLDIYGLNWLTVSFQYNDAVLAGNGNGTFAAPVAVPNSTPDDEDVDGIDYDLDGDVDVFIANFSGQERMYANAGGAFTLAAGVLPTDATRTKDSDAADLDGDGDPDIITANDSGQPEWLLINTTDANDVTPPRIARVEQAPDRATGASPSVVRAHVYDNSSYQETWYDHVRVEHRRNAGAAQTADMRSSMGQVFRGEIGAAQPGLISYRVLAADAYGNSSASEVRVFAVGATGAGYCFGDGTATACPCGNASPVGAQAGCTNSFGVGARLVASGTASVAADSITLAAGPLPDSPCLFFQGSALVNFGAGTVFGDGLRCAGGTVIRLGVTLTSGGVAAYPGPGDVPVAQRGLVPAGGGVRYYQVWYRNAAGFCTAAPFNLTNGWAIDWQP